MTLQGGLDTGWALETEILAPVKLSLVLDKVLTLLDSCFFLICKMGE